MTLVRGDILTPLTSSRRTRGGLACDTAGSPIGPAGPNPRFGPPDLVSPAMRDEE